MKAKWKEMMVEYGRLAIIVYLTIFALTFASFFVLIQFGFRDSVLEYFQDWLGDDAAPAGTLAMAYIVTKVLQPIRIAVTVAVVPIVGRKKVQSE